ncbi:sterol C-22 desaturase [Peziza echinospora]|nr:sterol C-22 desaturase [Peziza echinospora]
MDSQTSPSAVPGNAAPNVSAGGVIEQLFGSVSFTSFAVTVFLLCVAYDQFVYQRNRKGIVGPTFKLPFMGPFLESINPKFQEYAAKWASGPLSCVSVFHKFVVIASTRDLARKVLNSPQYVKPCVVDVAKKILRPTNWVFLDGKAHVDYRRGLNGLFTRKALGEYLPGQEDLYKRYFKRWVQISKETPNVPFMPEFREINCALSCRTFVGDYMSDEVVKRISDDYYKITAALELVNFPIIIPFTKTWYGKKCADMVLKEFADCAEKSKKHILAGGEPNCLLDRWVKGMYSYRDYEAMKERGEKLEPGVQAPVSTRLFTDFEIAQTLFTFLFASQDASSSCTTWLFQIMADRPEILDRVREEALAVRNGDVHKAIDMEMVDQMIFTRAVVKECLRYRPPVIMVPYEVKRDFPISEGYTVPKGSMVVSTLYPALHDPEVYPDPETFNPDRWITGDAEKAVKNWLVFGTGPHYCLGQTYAQLNFMAMISMASLFLDWEHHPTKISEDIKVFATIFPMDDCHLTFTERLPIRH